ncbi:hypothetical protein D3C87_482420 [compost metagenome]
MQIHMVIKSWQPFDEALNRNVKPFVYESAAHDHAHELNSKLTKAEIEDRTEYYVESYDLEEGIA